MALAIFFVVLILPVTLSLAEPPSERGSKQEPLSEPDSPPIIISGISYFSDPPSQTTIDTPSSIASNEFSSSKKPDATTSTTDVVMVFTATPQIDAVQEPGYWARATEMNRLRLRTMLPENDSKKQKSIRFQLIDVNELSTKNGVAMLNEIIGLLQDEPQGGDEEISDRTVVANKQQVSGVIIELLPSADVVWAQIVYDVASSLRLPVVVSDTRGPSFTPSPTPESADGNCYHFPHLLSAMPTQIELDVAMLEIIFAVMKNSRFAIVLIDHDEKSTSVLTSTIEELMNAATHRDQPVHLFRIKGYEMEADTTRHSWQNAVKEVSIRWRKFVIFSQKPELERSFIDVALNLGLAARGYIYFSLNYDFHLEPLNVPCTVGDQTSISALRLRRVYNNNNATVVATNDTATGQQTVNTDAPLPIISHADQEFSQLAIKTSIDAYNLALNMPLVNFAEARTVEKKCQKHTEILDRIFSEERRSWMLELLNMTTDGYFVRLQYSFSEKKINWVSDYELLTPAELAALRKKRRTKKLDSGNGQPNRVMPCRNNRWLRVTTIVEPPYVMRKKIIKPMYNVSLLSASTVKSSLKQRYKILRPNVDSHGSNYHYHSGTDAYEGYCIDLLELLSFELGFNYELTVVPDGKYGSMTENGSWDGLIGELENGRADVAVAPLTITQSRSRVVDFTQSFMAVGIGMLYYRQSNLQTNNDRALIGMFSFFRPFRWEVWLAAAASLLAYSLFHWFICWLSPVETNAPPGWIPLLNPTKPPMLPIPRPIWTVSNSVWLAVSGILQQGCDFFPASRSSRLLYITWGFVSLVLCSCYTANLAAFLTNERLEMQLGKPTDLLGQNKTKYGTLFGGSTQSFFKNSKIDIYRDMYANMARDQSLVQVQAEGVRRVLAEKGKYAFFLESTRLEYEVARDCRLVQVGSLLDSKGYGIATQKGSPLRDLISTSILKLQTEGVLLSLKNKWWIEQRTPNLAKCTSDGSSDKSSAPGSRRSASKLSMQVLGGAFIVLLCGVLFGVFVCLLEFVFYGVSATMRKDSCAINMPMVLSVWRFHVKRVFSAGATQIVLRYNKSSTVNRRQ